MLLAKPYGWPEKSFFQSVPGPTQTTIFLICLFVLLLPIGISIVVYILLLKERKSFETKNKVGVIKDKTQSPGKSRVPSLSSPSPDCTTQVQESSYPDLNLLDSSEVFNPETIRSSEDQLRDSNPGDQGLPESGGVSEVLECHAQVNAGVDGDKDAASDEPGNRDQPEQVGEPHGFPDPGWSSMVLKNSDPMPVSTFPSEGLHLKPNRREAQPHRDSQLSLGNQTHEAPCAALNAFDPSEFENLSKVKMPSNVETDSLEASGDARVTMAPVFRTRKASSLSQLQISRSEQGLRSHCVEGFHFRKDRRSLSLGARVGPENDFESRSLNLIQAERHSPDHQTHPNKVANIKKRVHYESDFESRLPLTSVAELFRQEQEARNQTNSDSQEEISTARIQAEKLSAMR